MLIQLPLAFDLHGLQLTSGERSLHSRFLVVVVVFELELMINKSAT